ncbi:uncharacterized protein [Acropora muricata]|uniref:uncharacterized protein n=1 Tax=Acropora muricata TaxID=159855 RepID=UPI0034E506BA
MCCCWLQQRDKFKEGISLHKLPFYDDDRPEAKRRRKKWVDFIRLKRMKWQASQSSVLCSEHFRREDFVRSANLGDGQNLDIAKRWLRTDDFGVCVFPSVHAKTLVPNPNDKPASNRAKRMTIREAITRSNHGKQQSIEEPACSRTSPPSTTNEASMSDYNFRAETTISEEVNNSNEELMEEDVVCWNCLNLEKENRRLKNRIVTLEEQVSKRKTESRRYRRQVLVTTQRAKDREMERTEEKAESLAKDCEPLCTYDSEISDFEEGEDKCENREDSDSEYNSETENNTTETETETDGEGCLPSKYHQLSMQGTNLRTEPKHIVFLSQLLVLFKFCHVCKADNPLIEAGGIGTEAVIKTTCSNPACSKEKTWYSQPLIPGTQMPAGNFLLCLSILLVGGSATKVFQMFSHMGLGHVSLNTFFKCQRNKLFPAIYLYWQRYQTSMLKKLKDLKDGITIAGDGRHDSMGHSAKYCAYTIFCCTVPMIIHFSLVQRNQAGSSTAMEFFGFKECMQYLIGYGLFITTFISDRHISIASHMKKVLHHIVHYFDIWHLKKKIRKSLTAISKLKGCEVQGEWIKPCERHLYWSATSTFNGNGRVIWAKFKSFLSHVVNQHSGFDDPLFNKCVHRDIQPRKWLKTGTVVYDKLVETLTENSLVKGIKQASPFSQTSSLEGFHSALNYFAPKMIAYSYVGMYCRHILAAVHFNFNFKRETKKRNANGEERIKVCYPKRSNSEGCQSST